MKISFLISLLLASCTIVKAQNLSRAHFKIAGYATEIVSAELLIKDVVFKINRKGNLENFNYLPGGEITYYTKFDGAEREGKIKSIGNAAIDYYDKFDDNDKLGKIKSIGNMKIDYYDKFDDADKFGKLKSIGNVHFDYYDKFDDTDKFGKLKLIDDVKIDYFDKFDEKELLGKIKAIGNVRVSYYDRFDNAYKGKLKSITGNSHRVYVTSRY